MNRYICTLCRTVFDSGQKAEAIEHCGQFMVTEFRPKDHSDQIVSSSNSWITLDQYSTKHWEEHPIFQRAQEEQQRIGSYSATRLLISFVNNLIEDNLDRDNGERIEALNAIISKLHLTISSLEQRIDLAEIEIELHKERSSSLMHTEAKKNFIIGKLKRALEKIANPNEARYQAIAQEALEVEK